MTSLFSVAKDGACPPGEQGSPSRTDDGGRPRSKTEAWQGTGSCHAVRGDRAWTDRSGTGGPGILHLSQGAVPRLSAD